MFHGGPPLTFNNYVLVEATAIASAGPVRARQGSSALGQRYRGELAASPAMSALPSKAEVNEAARGRVGRSRFERLWGCLGFAFWGMKRLVFATGMVAQCG